MKEKIKKAFFLLGDIFLLVIIFLLVFYLFFENKYDNKIYPNIYLNNVNLSGLDFNNAKALVEKEIKNFDNQGVEIVGDEKSFTWRNSVNNINYNINKVVVFNVDKAVDDAFLLGRSSNIASDFIFKLSSFVKKRSIFLPFFIDKEQLKEIVDFNFGDSLNIAQDAKLLSNQYIVFDSGLFPEGEAEEIIQKKLPEEISFSVTPETHGRNIDCDKFIYQFENNLKNLESKQIELIFIEGKPDISIDNSREVINIANSLLELAPFNLQYKEGKREELFEISKSDFSLWLKIEKIESNSSSDSEIGVSVDYDAFLDFLQKNIAPSIEREAINPQFEFINEKVSSFFPGQDGLKIDYEKSFNNFLTAFTFRDFKNIYLETKTDKIKKIGDINDLDIKEMIGTGHSNFIGSSANRRHNIKVGSSKISGLIIKPGEEFSLVEALGPTTKETGYLTELVIKGNKTIAEYGGGLCQVATTMFRSALGAGLPITERRNHSYRVSYYEPAGTDATIYSPRPDLKFKNDTEHNILIQARFENDNDMHFDLWGTSDGRIATTTNPVIYNIIRPGPTQIIETTDLKPGVKRCTERAHSGAETYFDYTVIYNPDTKEESKVETRFRSKYVPWREVCLLGVEVKKEEVVNTESIEKLESSEN